VHVSFSNSSLYDGTKKNSSGSKVEQIQGAITKINKTLELIY